MNKIFIIMGNEIRVNITRFSFLFFCFGFPLIAFLVFMGISSLHSGTTGTIGLETGNSTQLKREGYVDKSRLLKVIPPDVAAGNLLAFADEPDARQALIHGKIPAYYLIPEDYIRKGNIFYIMPELNIDARPANWGTLRRLLMVNMLGGDREQARQILNPLKIETVLLAPEPAGPRQGSDSPLPLSILYFITIIYTFVVLTASGLMLTSLVEEKKNRVLEILLLSVKPGQLITGKIAGLGMVGLIQTLAWSGTGYLLLRLAGRSLHLPPGFHLPLSILAWGILFFLLGYGLYAVLMAGLGALAPNYQTAFQLSFLIIMPLLIPFISFMLFSLHPRGTLFTVFSFVPFTAPAAMMTQLSMGDVPLWRPIVSALVLIFTIVVITHFISKLFQAQLMLTQARSDQSSIIRNYLKKKRLKE